MGDPPLSPGNPVQSVCAVLPESIPLAFLSNGVCNRCMVISFSYRFFQSQGITRPLEPLSGISQAHERQDSGSWRLRSSTIALGLLLGQMAPDADFS